MKFRSTRVSQSELDMTPMISVVFQLILLFMIINWFKQSEADERRTLPRDQLASPALVHRKHSLQLNFGYRRDPHGTILDQQPSFFFGNEQVTLDQVRPRLRMQAQYYETIGTALDDVTVEIRADAEIPAGMVQELIQMCQEPEIAFQRFALKATEMSAGL